MPRFGEDPLVFFETVYGHSAPWEIGSAQPAMVALLEDFPPRGTVVDLGSATGDLAIHLAQAGHPVVGVEFVESAVGQAQQKANALPAEVSGRLSFVVADATRPADLDIEFGAVVDSGFLHLLDPEETDRFVDGLTRALRSGDRYYLHEFAVEFPIENVPRAITREEINARFNAESGWRVLDVRDVEFLNNFGQPTAAIAACIERL